ncbi:BF3164 family lipoprotein [uncultured Bacteroides sp.]|uniref:BF3164 family lipoprotein n=1 Tax=uncultured Bacteroides sp. TaxID=162156 RepID=UPI0025D4D8F1|nr:BF3164 family lipoprotein [uncultured Bacteroides sp.]
MRLNTPILLIVLSSILCSCSKKAQDNFVSVTLDKENLSNAILLKTDSVWYPIDSIYAKKFYIYADTILIVENQKGAGNFLNFYNINTHNLITKLLSFGEGPKELLFAQMNYDGNSMRVMDYINRKLCNVNIDKVLKEKEYEPNLLSLSKNNIITSSPVSYGDSIIYVNPFHYVNSQENINQQPPRLIASTDENPEPTMPMDFDYMTFNVGQGFLGENTQSGKIFFASNEASFIEFYNSDLQLIKKVLGPVSLPEARLKISSEESGKRDVCYKGMIQPEAYRGFTYSGDKILFLYTGKEVPLNNSKEFQSYILCFDWEGNFLKSYLAPNRIYALSASAEPDTFYATIMDKEENPQLVKLTPFHSDN